MAQHLLSDVLVEIFHLCLPSDLSNASLTTSPVNLSQVCRSWRDIALEHTSLWATLRLRQDGGDIDLVKGRDAWKLWLRKSGTAPLTVDIYADRLLDDQDEEAFAEIMEITFAEQHRWKNVHVWCNSFTTNPSLKLHHLECAPHLQTLELRNHMPLSALPGCSQNELILDLSKRAQNIRTLSLGGVVCLAPTVCFMPNLHTVSIQAHGASPSSPALTIQDLFKILSSSPSLARLHASLIITAPDMIPLPAVTLHTLRSLKLNVCGFAEHLFVALTCPALEELHVSFLDELASSRETWVAVADLLARSRPPLRHLNLYSNSIHLAAPRREDELLSILRQAPSLRSVSLQGQYISNKSITALKLEPGASAQNVCPRLESLNLVCKRDHDITADCMADMIWSRYWTHEGKRAAVPLRELVLNLQEFERIESVPSLQACFDCGLRLTLTK